MSAYTYTACVYRVCVYMYNYIVLYHIILYDIYIYVCNNSCMSGVAKCPVFVYFEHEFQSIVGDHI